MLVPAVVLCVAFVLLASGVFVNPRLRRRVDRRHAVSRFVRVRSVDGRVFGSAEGRTVTCVDCGTRTNEGLVRRYREEYAVAGVPVYTTAENYNRYCVDCAVGEGSPPASSPPAPAREREGGVGTATERDRS